MTRYVYNQGHYNEWVGMGFIYVVGTPSIPNWVKIGLSINPDRRIAQLSTATPEPFRLIALWHTDNPRRAERVCHDALAEYRARSGREFFEVDTSVRTEDLGEYGVVTEWDVDYLLDHIDHYMICSDELNVARISI